MSIKVFSLARSTYWRLAISLQDREGLINCRETFDLQTGRSMAGGRR